MIILTIPFYDKSCIITLPLVSVLMPLVDILHNVDRYFNAVLCGCFDTAQCRYIHLRSAYNGHKEKTACNRYNKNLTHSRSKSKLAYSEYKEKLSQYQQCFLCVGSNISYWKKGKRFI
jgi:hypothetical protein